MNVKNHLNDLSRQLKAYRFSNRVDFFGGCVRFRQSGKLYRQRPVTLSVFPRLKMYTMWGEDERTEKRLNALGYTKKRGVGRDALRRGGYLPIRRS